MRKLLFFAILVAVVVAIAVPSLDALAASGKRRHERVERVTYYGPGVGTEPTGGEACHVGLQWGCVGWFVLAGERFVTLEIDDALGQKVSATFYEYDDDRYLGERSFCGATEKPLRLRAKTKFAVVFLFVGPCEDGSPAVASTGEVTATFSNRT